MVPDRRNAAMINGSILVLRSPPHAVWNIVEICLREMNEWLSLPCRKEEFAIRKFQERVISVIQFTCPSPKHQMVVVLVVNQSLSRATPSLEIQLVRTPSSVTLLRIPPTTFHFSQKGYDHF